MAIETFELRVCGVHMSEFVENVIHFQGTGTDPNDTYTAGKSLVDGWIANIETAWLAAMPATYEIRQYQARRVLVSPSAVYRKTFAHGTKVGTAGSAGESLQLCPCLLFVPPLGTKSLGKLFLPAVTQGSIVNNVYSAGYQTIITTLITAILTAFSQAGIAWVKVILSRKLSSASPAISAKLSAAIGFQKRRRAPTAAS